MAQVFNLCAATVAPVFNRCVAVVAPVSNRCAACLAFCAGLTGCAGSGRIDLASLDTKNIDPQRPLIQHIDLDSCRWWTDDDGTLWLAMTRKMMIPLGPAKSLDFELSLRLEKLPAGQARNYDLGADALRARIHLGPAETRMSSTAGIAVIERPAADRLHGVFRIQANREFVQLFGWSRGPRILLLAKFDAVRDDGRGRKVVESTESSGFQRSSPASRPTGPTSNPAHPRVEAAPASSRPEASGPDGR